VNGSVQGTFTSLPFGDGFTATGTDGDPYHFGTLDHDYETVTDHAQFRQYSNTQGRWMMPDPDGESYDQTNPQSISFLDPLGLAVTCQDVLVQKVRWLDQQTGQWGPWISFYKEVCVDDGTGAGGVGGPGASGGVRGGNGAAPNNGPVSPRQSCLDSFNNSTTGKIVNFLSPASIFIGPKPLHSVGEYAVGIPMKVGAYSLLRYQQTTNFLPYLAEGAADLMHFVATDLAGPVSGAAAALQIYAHASCGTLGNNSSATLGQTFSDESNPADWGVMY